MTPMQPPAIPGGPAQPSNVPPFPTPEDVAQIAQDTGFSKEKIMQDVQRTGAADKESLYPDIYGQGSPAAGGQQGIDPALAQSAGGYEEADEAMPVQGAPPQGEPDSDEAPQRMAARQAMSGAPPMQPGPEVPEENALGIGATNRKPFDVHDRARRMKARPY